MKGVILAGGTGSRLYPLTKITNKHLLPVYKKPMILYPIESLIKAGIKDIMIISGKGHAGDFLEFLGSGQKYGAHFSYAIQEEAGGIAQALGLAEDFVDNEKVVVYLGDNILQDDITEAVEEFKKVTLGGRIFLKTVDNPSSYGVARVEDDKILEIIEKPQEFVSDLAVIGVYMYDNQVWDIIKTLKPSGRGELEITDVNNFYVKQGTMKYSILNGWWGDCGESIDTWLDANNMVANDKPIEKSIISEDQRQKIRDITEEIINDTLKIVKNTAKEVSEKPKKSTYKKAYEPDNLTLENIVKNEDEEYTGNTFDINSYYSK